MFLSQRQQVFWLERRRDCVSVSGVNNFDLARFMLSRRLDKNRFSFFSALKFVSSPVKGNKHFLCFFLLFANLLLIRILRKICVFRSSSRHYSGLSLIIWNLIQTAVGDIYRGFLFFSRKYKFAVDFFCRISR